MYPENNLEKEFNELKLLIDGLAKVSGFPSELLSLIKTKIDMIESLSVSNDSLSPVSDKAEVKTEEVKPQINNDIFKLLTINDKFRFQRELFGNNPDRMSEAFRQLNSFEKLEDALSYICNECFEVKESDCFTEFCGLIENRFS